MKRQKNENVGSFHGPTGNGQEDDKYNIDGECLGPGWPLPSAPLRAYIRRSSVILFFDYKSACPKYGDERKLNHPPRRREQREHCHADGSIYHQGQAVWVKKPAKVLLTFQLPSLKRNIFITPVNNWAFIPKGYWNDEVGCVGPPSLQPSWPPCLPKKSRPLFSWWYPQKRWRIHRRLPRLCLWGGGGELLLRLKRFQDCEDFPPANPSHFPSVKADQADFLFFWFLRNF